jgi:hypothetical protein
MMAKAKAKELKLELYLKKDYEFTPYIHEISVMLPPLQTLILCNLINKLPGFNKQAKAKTHEGKDYHFKRNQNSIYEDELHIPKQTYTDNLKLLSKYVTYFGDRKERYKRGYNTTYFLLNLDAIQELFNEGRAKLGKQDKSNNGSESQDNRPQKQYKAQQPTAPNGEKEQDNKPQDKASQQKQQQDKVKETYIENCVNERWIEFLSKKNKGDNEKNFESILIPFQKELNKNNKTINFKEGENKWQIL